MVVLHSQCHHTWFRVVMIWISMATHRTRWHTLSKPIREATARGLLGKARHNSPLLDRHYATWEKGIILYVFEQIWLLYFVWHYFTWHGMAQHSIINYYLTWYCETWTVYIYLVFTKSVDSDFRVFWLAPVTRNILGYSLFCEQREKWHIVSRKF